MDNWIASVSAIGALIVSALTYLQSRRKTAAEIDDMATRIRSELLDQIATLTDRMGTLQRRVTVLETENANLLRRIAELEAENSLLRLGINKLAQQVRDLGAEPVWGKPHHQQGD